MLERLLTSLALSDSSERQMRFIAGPRQAGKTTLARLHLQAQGCKTLYYDWDLRPVRARYYTVPLFLEEDLLKSGNKQTAWVCFDEIHKMPKWKNILKEQFDVFEDRVRFIITGSARLDAFHRSGDSLAGRYFLHHLFPLTLREVTKNLSWNPPPENARDFVEGRFSEPKFHAQALQQLLTFSGFPEPFLRASSSFQRRWRSQLLDQLVREDLRDLTKILALENVAKLVHLLPKRIGSPLSLNSLTRDIEESHTAVRSHIRALELIYVAFQLSPYSKKLQRSLRKEKKLYFFDWTLVGDPAACFENYVACELWSWVSSWNDAGIADFTLNYIRTRDGKETDFLIVRDGKPWILLEAKLSDQEMDSHHRHHARVLGGIPLVQVVREEGIARVFKPGEYHVSASRFFS